MNLSDILKTTFDLFLMFLMVWFMVSIIYNTINTTIKKRKTKKAIKNMLDEIDIKKVMEELIEQKNEKEE